MWTPNVAKKLPKASKERLYRLLRERELFCRLLKVFSKEERKLVSFTPLPAQVKVWNALDKYNRVIVVKGRQMGISTAIRAWQFHKAFTDLSPSQHACLSFVDKSAKNLRNLDRQWIEELPELFKRKLSEDSAYRTIFEDTKAGLAAHTTGGRGGTRSFVFSTAHLSEFAFYTDPDETLAEVVNSVGQSGTLVIESTPNVAGDAFHRLAEGAMDGSNGWHLVFLAWWEHDAYRLTPPQGWRPEGETRTYMERYGLDLEQAYWREMEIKTLGHDKFRREYPATVQEAFQHASENAYFPSEVMSTIDIVPRTEKELELEPPHMGCYYTMGIDVSGGVGKDYAAITVVNAATNQPAYVWRCNRTAPHQTAHKAVEIAHRYTTSQGQPLILTESNNHGHATLLELSHLGYTMLWADRSKKPWTTTHKSKSAGYDNLREYIEAGMIERLDAITHLEVSSLVIKNVSPEAPTGGYDDSAMSLMFAYQALSDLPASKRRASVRGFGRDALRSKSRARKARATGATPFRSAHR